MPSCCTPFDCLSKSRFLTAPQMYQQPHPPVRSILASHPVVDSTALTVAILFCLYHALHAQRLTTPSAGQRHTSTPNGINGCFTLCIQPRTCLALLMLVKRSNLYCQKLFHIRDAQAFLSRDIRTHLQHDSSAGRLLSPPLPLLYWLRPKGSSA